MVVPTFTVRRSGLNTKLSIVTGTTLFCATDGAMTQASAAPVTKAINSIRIGSTLQRRVDDGEALLAALEGHTGDAQHRTKLVIGDLHRTGRRRAAWRRLRVRRRAG